MYLSSDRYRVVEDRSMAMGRVALGVLTLAAPMALIEALSFGLMWGFGELAAGFDVLFRPWTFLAVLVLGVLAHELLHCVTWAVYAHRPLSSIRLGFQWRTGTPFAHVGEPLPVGAYRWGGAMPFLLLGVAPFLLGLLLGQSTPAAFGLLFTLAAGGDLVVLEQIRDLPPDALLLDHHERAGCLVVAEGRRAKDPTFQ